MQALSLAVQMGSRQTGQANASTVRSIPFMEHLSANHRLPTFIYFGSLFCARPSGLAREIELSSLQCGAHARRGKHQAVRWGLPVSPGEGVTAAASAAALAAVRLLGAAPNPRRENGGIGGLRPKLTSICEGRISPRLVEAPTFLDPRFLHGFLLRGLAVKVDTSCYPPRPLVLSCWLTFLDSCILS